jgi:hypothetical protein
MIGCMVDHAGKLSPMRIIKLLARMGGAGLANKPSLVIRMSSKTME